MSKLIKLSLIALYMFVLVWLIYYNYIIFGHDLKKWVGTLFIFGGGIWLLVLQISSRNFITKSNAKAWIIAISAIAGIFWGTFILIALFHWIGIFPLTSYQLGLIFSVTWFFSPLIIPLLIGFYFFYLKSIPGAIKGKNSSSDSNSLNKVKEYGFGLTVVVGFLQGIIWFVFPAFSLFGLDFIF